MKIKDLLQINPESLDISSILLVDERTILELANDLVVSENKVTKVTIKNLRFFVEQLSLEQQENLLSIKLYDDGSDLTTEEALSAFSSIQPRNDGVFARDVQGGVVTYSLMLGCMAILANIIFVSMVTKQMPDTLLTVTVLGYMGMIAWLHMGVINKERRDVLSLFVGDKNDSSVITSILGGLAKLGRRKKN